MYMFAPAWNKFFSEVYFVFNSFIVHLHKLHDGKIYVYFMSNGLFTCTHHIPNRNIPGILPVLTCSPYKWSSSNRLSSPLIATYKPGKCTYNQWLISPSPYQHNHWNLNIKLRFREFRPTYSACYALLRLVTCSANQQITAALPIEVKKLILTTYLWLYRTTTVRIAWVWILLDSHDIWHTCCRYLPEAIFNL